MRIAALSKFVALVGGVVASGTQASVVINQSIEEMSATAPVIVEGKVIQSQARLDADGQKIFTYSEVEVSRITKGKHQGSVMVRQPGGVVGNWGQRVSGAAQFVKGEQVLLFLEPASDEPNVYVVWSMSAGKISLVHGPDGAVVAHRDTSGLHFYGEAKSSSGTIRSLNTRDYLGPLQSLRKRIEVGLHRQIGDKK